MDTLGVFAEFETNLRRERQLEGIAVAIARGAYRGRKPSIDPLEVQRLQVEEKLTEEAIDLLATKLRTPLQIQLHLSLSLEAGYLTGAKPISAELVESVRSRQLDDLEPPLTRH